MKKSGKLVLMSVIMLCVNLMNPLVVSASESDSSEDVGLPRPEDVLVFDDDDSSPVEEAGDISDVYIPVYDDWEEQVITPASVTGTVYSGTISTTYLDYFKGFMSHRPGTPYVVFRSDAYNYYMFYGDDLVNYGFNFSGSGQYVRYYTQTGYIYRGTDYININAENGFVYSNMSDSFPAFYEERGLLNEKTVLFVLVVIVCIWVFSRIFFRRG